MERRTFVKALPTLPVLTGAAIALDGTIQTKMARGQSSSAGAQEGVPEYAKNMLTSDMQGLGPDGKPTGQEMTFTGASKAAVTAEEAAKHRMSITADEQAILDGSKGPEMAKLMKIQVMFGNIFGADKLVDLGGAPHSNLYPGAPYMGSMIKMLDQCAKAGLKAYAPYTVNPRPYDCFNVQNTPEGDADRLRGIPSAEGPRLGSHPPGSAGAQISAPAPAT